jgi:hypothetical protein
MITPTIIIQRHENTHGVISLDGNIAHVIWIRLDDNITYWMMTFDIIIWLNDSIVLNIWCFWLDRHFSPKRFVLSPWLEDIIRFYLAG